MYFDPFANNMTVRDRVQPAELAPDAVLAAAAVRAPAPARFSPLYRQIRDQLLHALEQGEWRPGQAIPSEIELAARFGVSQGTVRKAIDELASENLLVRRQGKGTFVATHQEAFIKFRFLSLRPDAGEPVPAQSQVLSCRRTRASAEVARALALRAGDSVLHIRRLLRFEGQATVLDDIWLPGAMFRGLTTDRVLAYTGPMYALFETECGVQMIRAEERLKAVLAGSSEAEPLGVAPGTPLLLVDRSTFTFGDRPVEWRRGHCLTSAHHYRNVLN